MKKIFKIFKDIIYGIGILCLYSMTIVFIYDSIQKKEGLYVFFLIGCTIYSLIIMVVKIIKSIDLLESVLRLMKNPKINKDEKIENMKYLEYDIDSFLNKYKN